MTTIGKRKKIKIINIIKMIKKNVTFTKITTFIIKPIHYK